MNDMSTFSEAIEAAKEGAKIARTAWAGTQYVALSAGISYKSVTGDMVDVGQGDTSFILVSHRRIHGNWAASADDMLAEDWTTVVEEV